MHFLSHYYHELPNNNPLFVVALIVPDLTPGFTRLYNRSIRGHSIPGHLSAIRKGIETHFNADKKFHNSPCFMQQVEAFTRSFTDMGLSRQRLRLSVIAHLAVEMLLDRQIVIAHKDVCNDFYRCIDNAPEDDLIAFFEHYSLHRESGQFLPALHFFKQRRFLYLFDELENIVFGLNRVYARVCGTEFTGAEKDQFLAALRNNDGIIRYRWQEILNV